MINIPGLQEGVVIFAGAGCSMAPPSSLPGWNQLNDAILDTLWDRMEQFGIRTRFRDQLLTAIRQKRAENTFPPDYQAQRMVERAGIRYFELLSAVDTDTYNAVQYYTAGLAKAGLLKAVVTTNFDQNFERAFAAYDIPFEAFYDEAGFNRLASQASSNGIPIIKIHGSCSSPASMVDTRKQRLKGRAKALQDALFQLLELHHFIFCGFSGQDFDDNRNYLGLQDAAPAAKGFTYTYMPGSKVRASMNEVIGYYGKKAQAVEYDPAQLLGELVQAARIGFTPFAAAEQVNTPLADRLREKSALLEPMDAINMLTALAESYGDEVTARFIYDKAWRERYQSDYEGEALSRFLLNHGRSYVFNFQDRIERAANVGVHIEQAEVGPPPPGMEDLFTNPARMNLKHTANTSPETPALIGLAQTYFAITGLFEDFPKKLSPYFRRDPSPAELADILYYYSFHALVQQDMEAIQFLHHAIQEMEADFDEPRLSQLLSRRAMFKLRINHPEALTSAREDVMRAKALAEKYHEPHLLALSALAQSILARKENDFATAFTQVGIAEKNYWELKRIPQYVETIVEYLKVLMLGFEQPDTNKQQLLDIFLDIEPKINAYVVDKINVFEPECCYLVGLFCFQYTNAPKATYMSWLADAVSLAEQNNQPANYAYFRETCQQLGILEEIEALINKTKAAAAGNQASN
ncbi:SIR2 family protein [Paraflavitalea soli]|uniref:SIR2 family protein n=1 Tax=Paraflavitalea soli TaxID=2315862 RepID=A0A3B7MGZ8_9BACT|nr:SIR2 family protein [Paraflavitalea soli]AXY72593.1 SIR2 family protein [Paraflavitalea soli]